MSVYYCESCLTNQTKYIDGNSLPVTIAGQPNVGFNIGDGFNNVVRTTRAQSDGKIIVGGYFDEYSGTSVGYSLIRLESDGSIDTSFDVGTGFFSNYYSNLGEIYSIQIQSDGKILVGGTFDEYSGSSVGQSLIRLESDGTIDASFNIGTGFFSNSFGGSGYILSIQIQSDGKILVGGTFDEYSGTSVGYGLIRLESDGSIDTSFDVGVGFYNNSFGDGGIVYSIQIQPDGKIIVGGLFDEYSGTSVGFGLIRLESDGSIDNSFDVGIGFYGEIYSTQIQSDGKILVGGWFNVYNGTSVGSGLIRLESDGSIDTSFDVGSGFEGGFGLIQPIQIQSDGKIIVGGDFTSYSGVSRNYIIRLNTDGSIDTSFVIGTGFNGIVNTIQLQSDGKILVGGSFTSYDNETSKNICSIYSETTTLYSTDFRCYTPLQDVNGLVDFGFNGVFNNTVRTTQLQPDGKILLGGSFTSYNGVSRNYIIRLNIDGSIDNGFTIGIGFDNIVNTIELQIDGKILVGGAFTSYSGVTRNRIIRLNTDGSVDTSFVIGTGFNNTVRAIQLQSDGKILVGGSFSTYSGVSSNDIIRLNTNGSIDTSFVIGNGFNNFVNTIQLQPDSKILVGGFFNNYKNILCRNVISLNIDGSINELFNIGSGFNNQVYAIELQENGTILFGGDFTTFSGYQIGDLDFNFNNELSFGNIVYSSLKDSNNDLYVGSSTGFIKLNTDGSTQTMVNTDSSVLSIEELSDSSLLLAGSFLFYDNLLNGGLVKVDTYGNKVAGFDVGGGFGGSSVRTTKELPSGKILVGGDFVASGSTIVDITFGGGGLFNASVYTSIEQPDGKILVGGQFTSYSGVSSNRIIRLNTDGSVDTSFVIGTGFNFSDINTIQLQPDGKILVGGTFTSYSGVSRNRIIRLNTDGSIDSSFVIGTGFDSTVFDIELQSDGKILVGGQFTSYSGVSRSRIIRLNTDGSVDTSFVIGTGFAIGFGAISVRTIKLQINGKILVGGSFTSYSGVTRNSIIRLNTDGSIDTSFVIGTGFSLFTEIWSTQIQSDGKILVGGQFTSYSGVSRSRIIRLNTDGSVDTSFVIGTGFNTTVQTIELQPDGKILVGGQFTSYSGVSINRIIGLNTDGSIDTSFVIGTGADSTVRGFIPKTGFTFVYGSFITINDTSQNYFSKVNYSGNTGIVLNRFTRINSDGTNDETFSAGTRFDNTVRKIILQPDNKILIGGNFTSYSGITSNRIIRLNSDNSLDTSFVIGTGFNLGQVSDIQLQSDGKILVGGSFTQYSGSSYNRIIRLNTDGSIDTSFVIGTGFTSPSAVQTLEIQSDGKILVGGTFSSYSGVTSNRLIRLNNDGSYDDTFVVNPGFNNSILTITQVSNDFIMVGGLFSTYDNLSIYGVCQLHLTSSPSTSFNKFAVLNPDGSADTTVNIGTGFSDSVRSIVARPNGKLMIGGDFTSYSGITLNRIIQLNNDYTNDTTFDTGDGFNNTVYTLTLQPNGETIIGGDFTSYNGDSYLRLVRLFEETPTAEYQAILLFNECEECNGYIIPISANTEYIECLFCEGDALLVDAPHPVWTGLNGGAVTQLDAVTIGGNGWNS